MDHLEELKEFARLHARGQGIATHQLEELPASATHALLLRDGRVVAAGPFAEALSEGSIRRAPGLGDLDVAPMVPVAFDPDLGSCRDELRPLLALYAGQPVHREVLVDAMWPQLDVSAATHNLHVCVSGLRSALEPGVSRGASRAGGHGRASGPRLVAARRPR